MTQQTTGNRKQATDERKLTTVNYVYAIRNPTMKGVYTTTVMKQMR